MPRFLERCAEAGWTIYGAAAEKDAILATDVSAGVGPILVVLGNEGRGLRPIVRKHCSKLIAIQGGAPPSSGVDSLNVSVACGVLLHQLLHNRKPSPEYGI
jgi:tRNA G18 (ribose-2'-O)-methylase SpoU